MEVYALFAAALVFAVGGFAIAASVFGRRVRPVESVVDFATWTGILAASLSFGSAAIHFAVIGEHFAEYPPYGLAFTAFAWFQVGWAVLYLVRRSRGLAALAILVNVGALIVWAVSRAFGLPIGPEPGAIEPIGPLDQLTGALELALIGILGWDLAAASDRRRPSLSPSSAVVTLGSAILAVVVLTSAALAAVGGDPHGGAAHEVPPAGTPAPTQPEFAESTARASTSAPPTASLALEPGKIRFGASLDLDGRIAASSDRFRPGERAVWIATFSEPPNVPSIRLVIVEILPDGREFEHWRQEIALDDPGGRRLVAGADLALYVHGGEGSYRMRYVRAEELLAEGRFEFVP